MSYRYKVHYFCGENSDFFCGICTLDRSLLTLPFLFFQFENLVESDEVSISIVVQNPHCSHYSSN